MSLGPITLVDTFSRTVTDDWGTSDSGHAWSGVNSSFDVDGSSGTIAVSAGDSYRSAYIDFSDYSLPNQGSGEVLILTKWTGSSAYPATDFGPVLSRTASNTFYFGSLQGSYGEVAIGCYVNGVRYELNRSAMGLSKNTWYYVRFRRDSGGLKLRVWAKNTKEPGSWSVTSGLYDGSNPPGSGDFGIYRRGLSDAYTISVHDFYGWTLEDEYAALPIIDSFERTVDEGWGYANSGHIWEGNFAHDPAVYILDGQGNVTDPGNGYAALSHPDTTNRIGFIGQSVTGDVELLAEVRTNTNNGNTWINLGLRGASNINATTGATEYTGYFCEFKSNATTISIKKITAFGGSATNIVTSGAFTAIAANTDYWIRFQITGTTVRARIWIDGAGEPGTWNASATDASIATGRAFVSVEQNVAATKAIRVSDFWSGVPTPGTTTYTGTGALTSTAITDSTLALRAAFTNDSNTNNSITVEYKKTSETTWTTFGGTKTRVGSPLSYTFTLTGLASNTAYNTRVTFSDADTVSGTNPVLATFTTTNNALTTSPPLVNAIGTTTATIYQPYLNDSDSDSTAVLDYRATTSEVQIVNDSFTDYYGVALQSHTPEIGGTWTRHTASTGTIPALIASGRVYHASTAANDLSLYYSAAVPPSAEYDILADFYATSFDGHSGIAGRIDTSAHTCYAARYSFTNQAWEIIKVVAGTVTTLVQTFATLTLNQVYSMRFIIRDAYKILMVDGVEVCRTTDNAITATGRAGLRFMTTVTSVGTPSNRPGFDDFIVVYRTGVGSWTSAGSMTADRPNLRFTKNLTGLTTDTVYEFRTTITDADGISGPNPQSITAITIGQAVYLSSAVGSAQQTTATIDTAYLYDSNNNSTLSVQYRSIMDHLWTTAPSMATTADRGNKKFVTLLASLRPNTTYQFIVTISDVNGYFDGSPTSLKGLFTTKGYTADLDLQDKQYLWKVYDVHGAYITTWTDAGQPSFGYHENGGVSDLTVSLPRKMNTIDNPTMGVGFQNRVDIWAIDPSSDGMGRNLVVDYDFNLGSWTLGANANISTNAGPDDSACLRMAASATQYVTRSSPILLRNVESIIDGATSAIPVPVVLKATAKVYGSKLVMFVEAYDINDNKIEESDITETVGSDWQTLRLEYLPRQGTHYLRVAFKNDASGYMFADKVELRAKEMLIYRGRIETFTPQVTQDGEKIDVDILGLVSLLSDDYIDFLQFVVTQPANDAAAGRENLGPTDPGQMLRTVLAVATKQNPNFSLYATTESIHNTGYTAEYTFRNKQLRACIDQIRTFCPADWHYFVEPDGLVVLRGPEHGDTHTLRRSVEIMNISIEKSIRNLKNYVLVKGRQDEDNSEPDGFGSINYVTFDQESIDKYGKRVLHIQDANIKDPDTAELVGNGRLDEHNHEEQRVQCVIPDDKSIIYTTQSLRGYNIESFRPGDSVLIIDPVSGPKITYWDTLIWDQSYWDFENVFTPLPSPVPIKTIQYEGTQVRLELSERPPSAVGEFGVLYRWLATKDSED